MVDDLFKLVSRSSLYGSPCINVWHYMVDSDPPGGEPEKDIIGSFKTLVLPAWMDICSVDFMVDCLSVTKVAAGVNPTVIEVLASGNTGAINVDALPPNKTYLLSLQSAVFTKQGRGRKFLSGIPETFEVDNAIIAAQRTNCDTFGLAAATDLTGGPGLGQYSAAIYSETAGIPQRVRHFDFHPAVHSLRGRTAVRC